MRNPFASLLKLNLQVAQPEPKPRLAWSAAQNWGPAFLGDGRLEDHWISTLRCARGAADRILKQLQDARAGQWNVEAQPGLTIAARCARFGPCVARRWSLRPLAELDHRDVFYYMQDQTASPNHPCSSRATPRVG